MGLAQAEKYQPAITVRLLPRGCEHHPFHGTHEGD
jgi:hypothetical protein